MLTYSCHVLTFNAFKIYNTEKVIILPGEIKRNAAKNLGPLTVFLFSIWFIFGLTRLLLMQIFVSIKHPKHLGNVLEGRGTHHLTQLKEVKRSHLAFQSVISARQHDQTDLLLDP